MAQRSNLLAVAFALLACCDELALEVVYCWCGACKLSAQRPNLELGFVEFGGQCRFVFQLWWRRGAYRHVNRSISVDVLVDDSPAISVGIQRLHSLRARPRTSRFLCLGSLHRRSGQRPDASFPDQGYTGANIYTPASFAVTWVLAKPFVSAVLSGLGPALAIATTKVAGY